MFGQAGVSPVGKKLWNEKLHRMYEKNQGLRKRIGTSLHSTELVTPNGIFIRHGMSINLERVRLERIASKIVRGLYYFEFGNALPPTTEIVSRLVQDSFDVAPIKTMVSQLRFGTKNWHRIFEYKFDRIEEKPNASIWLTRFYESYIFLSVTDDNEYDDNPGKAS